MIPLPYFLYFQRKKRNCTKWRNHISKGFVFAIPGKIYPSATKFPRNLREKILRVFQGRFSLFLTSTSLTSLAISLCLNSFEHYHRHGPRLSIGHANQYVSVLNSIFNYCRASCDKFWNSIFFKIFFVYMPVCAGNVFGQLSSNRSSRKNGKTTKS